MQFLANQDKDSLNIDQLRDCLKRSNQTIFAQLIVELGEKVLEPYNQSPTAVFPKLKLDKEGSFEGNRVKGAMKELRLINKLIAVILAIQDPAVKEDDQLSLVSDFIDQCENIIKTSNPIITNPKTINDNFQKFLEKAVGNCAKKIDIKDLDNKNMHTNLLPCLKQLNLEKVNVNNLRPMV